MYRLALSCFVAALIAQPVWAGKSLGREYTAAQRIQPAHLEAVHTQVQTINEKRQESPKTTRQLEGLGLSDFRAIFHTHAGDSAHTGGTPEELLRGAHETGLQVVFLSDHFRPPRDFMDSWRGLKEGVLFIPGSESHGFLVHPDESVFEAMSGDKQALIDKVGAGSGMLFLSHVEERTDHPMDGITGMEVYNRHYDAMDDMMLLLHVVQRLTKAGEAEILSELIAKYPDEFFAAQQDYPQVYMDKWDAESIKQRVVGVAANDCHHNNVLIMKVKDDKTAIVGTNVDDDDEMQDFSVDTYPGLAELLKGKSPGDVLARLDIDPYPVAIDNVSTHIFASEQTEASMREAVRSGHAYVSHDWLCTPKGFLAWVEQKGKNVAILGDEITFTKGQTLKAQFPVSCNVRLFRNGEVIKEDESRDFSFKIKEPGVYRLEAWLEIDGEQRTWIYANPIYVRESL